MTFRPLPQVLASLADELTHLGDCALDLETIATVLLSEKPGDVAPDMLSDLQKFDTLVQSLSALSLFCQSLSKQTDPRQDVDISDPLRTVHLGDMVTRLVGSDGDHDVHQRTGTELF